MTTEALESDVLLARGGDEAAFRRLVERCANTVCSIALLGGAFGWARVLMGMKALDPPFDEREARELRRFRNVVLLLVTLGAIVIAASSVSAMRLLISVQSLYLVLGLLYALWLPRILQRRRTLLWKMIGRAAGAAVGGVIVMAVLVTI